MFGQISIGGIGFDIRTMLVACTCLIVGIQGIGFAAIARSFAKDMNLLSAFREIWPYARSLHARVLRIRGERDLSCSGSLA